MDTEPNPHLAAGLFLALLLATAGQLALLAASGGPASRAAPLPASTGTPVAMPTCPPGPVWCGRYYANPDLAGEPVFVRADPQVDFEWTGVGPGPGIGSHNYSVRWTRTLYLREGDYSIRIEVDDGVRFWIDDELLLDQWRNQYWTYDLHRHLERGYHSWRLEYYQRYDQAIIRLSWSPPGAPAVHLPILLRRARSARPLAAARGHRHGASV